MLSAAKAFVIETSGIAIVISVTISVARMFVK
jgi:hypothetical protein